MLQYPHKTVPRLYEKWIFLASSIFATQLFCSCAAFFIAFGGGLFESNVYERAAHFGGALPDELHPHILFFVFACSLTTMFIIRENPPFVNNILKVF